ncbi:protein SIX6OS1 isoform X2 [Amia ocellicauda]|uniref:protein SIX6OS1 isoform X2 n=1 Tax=Amia ocellicauda TaxID=2972642 RepID=UPI0034638863
MGDSIALTYMDNLLLRLAFSANISEKKTHLQEIKKKIDTFDEELIHRGKLVKHYKDNIKSMKATNCILLQYEKTLQAELERYQVNTNEDTKMYQERTESYKEVFQQHKARYCQNPLAQQLLQKQSERDEIEQRLRTIDQQIAERERELQALRGSPPTASQYASQFAPMNLSTAGVQTETDSKCEDDSQLEAAISTMEVTHQQSTASVEQEDGKAGNAEELEIEEKEANEKHREEHVLPGSSLPLVGLNKMRTNSEMHGQLMNTNQEQALHQSVLQETHSFINVAIQEQRPEAGTKQEHHPHLPGNAESDDLQESGAGVEEPALPYTQQGEKKEDRPPPFSSTPPARMKISASTPTFTLKSSSDPEGSHSPAFVFSMSPGPQEASALSSFSGFDCDVFGTGSSHEQDNPFSFSSSYFGEKNKKSTSTSGCKQSGFLFEQLESGGEEEEFQFSFPSKSSTHNSHRKEQGSGDDPFSFSLNFGKF